MGLSGPKKLQTLVTVIADGATSKSYLQGLQQLVDLASGEPYQFQRLSVTWLTALTLAGLRNEIGKIINPQQRELGTGITDAGATVTF